MIEIRLIDANALKVEIMKIYKDYIDGNFFWTKVFNLIDNAPTVDLKDIYQEGHYDGQLEGYTRAINEEITDEDIGDAIKAGYKDGYEMAKAKCEFNIEDFKQFVEGKIDMQDLYSPSHLFMLLDEYLDMKGGAE